MKQITFFLFLFLTVISSFEKSFSQGTIEAGDPPNNTEIPNFFKSMLPDIEEEVNNIIAGKVPTSYKF